MDGVGNYVDVTIAVVFLLIISSVAIVEESGSCRSNQSPSSNGSVCSYNGSCESEFCANNHGNTVNVFKLKCESVIELMCTCCDDVVVKWDVVDMLRNVSVCGGEDISNGFPANITSSIETPLIFADNKTCFWWFVEIKVKQLLISWCSVEYDSPRVYTIPDGFFLDLSKLYISDKYPYKFKACLEDINILAKVLTYFNMIFELVSLISIAVVIWIILKYERLRNVYGICLISLSVILAVEDVLFLLLSLRPPNGFVIMLVVVLHFILIAVFAWELVILIHVKRSISLGSHGANNTVTLSRTSARKTVIIYNVLGFGLPIPCLIVGIIFHVISTPDIFQYGLYWYINYHNTVTFVILVLPIACLEILSDLLFLNIMYSIRHSLGTSNVQSTSSGGSHLMPIAIRLKCILGFPTFISVLVITIFESHIFNVITFTIDALRGFLMMIAFISTKRVRSLIKATARIHPSTEQ
ncbi:uncharacterized protein [Apostichopus japonicus]|uniref:uncharacterized protein n=1 Tax=Stichopus japonicus TaxID=307972 RepID=UPI003AB5BA37